METVIRYHESTGDAELVVYVGGMRVGEYNYYLEDGGLQAAVEAAKKISRSKPFISRI